MTLLLKYHSSIVFFSFTQVQALQFPSSSNEILGLVDIVKHLVQKFIACIKMNSLHILYFKTPSEIFINNQIKESSMIRVGGMVKKDTLNIDDNEIKFIITDFKNEIKVSFKGTIPNLFAEGKGVVAEGN